MTDQQQPRPPLWQAMVEAEHRTPLISGNTGGGQSWLRRKRAAEIRAFAQYLIDHGLIATGKPTPRMGAQLLEALEREARRAEEGQ